MTAVDLDSTEPVGAPDCVHHHLVDMFSLCNDTNIKISTQQALSIVGGNENISFHNSFWPGYRLLGL